MNKTKKLLNINNDPKEIKNMGGLVHYQFFIHKTYGTIVHFNLNKEMAVVSVNDLKLVEQAQAATGKPAKFFQFFKPILGSKGLPFLNLKDAIPERKIELNVLKNPDFKIEYIKHTNSLTNKWIARQTPKITFDIQEEMRILIRELMLSFTFGIEQNNPLLLRFISLYEKVLETSLSSVDSHQKINENHFSNLIETIDNIIKISDKEISLLGMYRQADPNLALLRYRVLGAITASYQLVSPWLSWTLFLLAQNPESQDKLRSEIDNLITNRQPSIKDINNLDFLDMVIKESMRMYTINPYTMRETEKTITLGDYCFPPKTIIMIPIYVIHKNPQFWLLPNKFLPERFADSKKIKKFSYIPWGIAPRKCPGNHTATMIIKAVLIAILQNFYIHRIEQNIEFQDSFFLWAKSGIQIELIKRFKTITRKS